MAERLNLTTPTTSLVLVADKGQPLRMVYYGTRLSDADYQQVFDTETWHDAFPVYGQSTTVAETALAVRHCDGNMTLDMVVDKVEMEKTDATHATQTLAPVHGGGEAQLLRVTLRDRVFPFTVDVCYMAYSDADVIETWTEIEHQEKKPVTLTQFASGYLPVRQGEVWLCHLHGSWGDETQLTRQPLGRGMMVIKNKDGVRNSHYDHSEIMLSLDGHPMENDGRTIGAALCYSGNYKLRIDSDEHGWHRFVAGINEENSWYTLPKGVRFVTPVLALTYSNEGMSGVSRNMHTWARRYRIAHGYQDRSVLLNSWEGVYMDVNEPGMAQMMGDIASMHGELFVMDDGWFGSKHARKRDDAGLGDWHVNTEKLPGGIGRLVQMADSCGVKFGIWIEPEMANTASELYEQHPDWVIKAPQRELRTGRGGTQVVLDMGNPKVQDFVFGVVDDLMQQNPKIAYIKWDANMHIAQHGSQYLGMDEQSHLYIEYHKGFAATCDRIRQKYPDLVIQACASGGGRANYGVLPWFDEVWVSDNTDALQRIYMQWGTSMFFPASVMAAHISASPGHQTQRLVPIKYRADVAFAGRLGMEIQPKNMNDEEKRFCRQVIDNYKRVRKTVQHGDIYRLVSPYDNRGVASMMYVAPDKHEAVFYWWRMEYLNSHHLQRIPLRGLDPNKTYIVEELNRMEGSRNISAEGKSFTGAYLMQNGLNLPETTSPEWKLNAWHSRVILLHE